MKHKNTVIIIAGPTASGKTALSLQLAEHFKTSIISADSRQCFKELNIGVAKPTVEELHRVKHYFIDSHSIFDNVTAQTFEEYAIQAANEIFQHGNIAVMAGGTGLYIKAFCEGLDPIPEVDASVRKKIIDDYGAHGLTWLQEEVKTNDALFWKIAEQQNPQRLMRALEVIKSTGRSITEFRSTAKKERDFNIIKIGLSLSKVQLHSNINERTERMIENGLIKEAEILFPHKKLNALQTVGYKESFEFLEGRISLPAAIEMIKHNTRQYAKRQLTWFNKDKEFFWVDADMLKNKDGIFSFLKQLY